MHDKDPHPPPNSTYLVRAEFYHQVINLETPLTLLRIDIFSDNAWTRHPNEECTSKVIEEEPVVSKNILWRSSLLLCEVTDKVTDCGNCHTV